MWSLRNVIRLAHADACAELSDRARSSTCTYADGYARGGELVEEAESLVRQAEQVRLLAVAAERARGVSWEAIGEALGGVSKQAAQKRFGELVDALELDVLLPEREGPDVGAPGWTAGPDAVSDPDATLQRLDAWAKRHHERTDGGSELSDRLVSHGLRERPARALDHTGVVTKLAALLLAATGPFARRELPPGVTERYARRRLLEAKVAAFDAMMRAERPGGQLDAAARDQAVHASDELVAIRTDEARDQLALTWTDEDNATVTLWGRPVAILGRTADRDADVCGWWLWGIDEDGCASDRGGAWPQLVDEDLDAQCEHIEHAAREEIANMIGSDQAKGIGPFEPDGIAGLSARSG